MPTARPRPDFALNQPERSRLRDPGRRPQLRLRLLARARALGAARLRLPRGDQHQIADIFRSNALKNGLLPVLVDEATHAWLLAHPGAEVAIDLETPR